MQGKVIVQILSVWAACFIIGLIWGKAASPDYSVRSEIENHLEPQINLALIPALNSSAVLAGGRTIPSYPVIAASYRGDRYSYLYRQDSGAVMKVPNQYVAYRSNTKGMDQAAWVALLLAAGIPKGYSLADISPVIKSGGTGVKVLAIVGGILGVGLGYKAGYSDKFNPDLAPVREVLFDPVFWEGVIMRHRSEIKTTGGLRPFTR